jgi:hypothetical protein
MLHPEPFRVLLDNVANLNARDQAFANSLMNSRTLSAKQHQWIAILADRATSAKAPPVAQHVGDIQPIVALVDRARSRLKWPSITLETKAGTMLRVSVAGPSAREPGSITITDAVRRNAEGKRLWLGRITKAGAFESSRACSNPGDVAETLSLFAANPAGIAAEYGHRHGHCCFCIKPLDDERSTAVGYGPTCAKNWDLPWGAKAAKLVCEPA